MTVAVLPFSEKDHFDATPTLTKVLKLNQRRNDPYAATTQPFVPAPPKGVAHQPLVGRCTFVGIPLIRPTARPSPVVLPPSATCCVLTQTRFELNPAELRWIVRQLAGVTLLDVQQQQSSGDQSSPKFVCWAADAVQAQRVVDTLHQKILFDHRGLFAPLNAMERRALREYVKSPQFRIRSQKLPRDCIRAELLISPPTPPHSTLLQPSKVHMESCGVADDSH